MKAEEAATALLLQGNPPKGLRPIHFEDEVLRKVWMCAEGLEQPSIDTILERAEGSIKETRLMVLEAMLPDSSPADIARIVLEEFHKRRLDGLIDLYQAGNMSAPMFGEEVQKHTVQVEVGTSMVPLIQAVDSAIEKVKNGQEIGIPFPYPSLVPILGDLMGGSLTVLSGYTGQGKTALALNMALRIARDFKVNLMSLEMTKEELAFRCMSIESGVSNELIRHNLCSDEQKHELANAVARMGELDFNIDDRPQSTIDYIEGLVESGEPEDRPDLLIIDHLHMMQGNGVSRTADIGDIARRLKLLAMRNEIAILLLAQLRKVPAGQKVPEPGLDDLRDSAEIQQAANAVAFVYKKEDDEDMSILVKKNRSGPLGNVEVKWEPQLTRMKDLTELLYGP